MSYHDLVYKHHLGVHCEDFAVFFRNCKDQPLETYLNRMEDDTHGMLHFTFGGVGGDHAVATVATLQNIYGFSPENVVALDVSAQAFTKFYLAMNVADFNERGQSSGKVFPLNCTTNPWQDNELTSSLLPGELNGPQCDFANSLYDSDTTLNQLVELFFPFPAIGDSISTRIQSLEFDDKRAVMQLIANMFPYYGEMAGSGAGEQVSDFSFSF
jgi:hypothetical protein